MTKTTFREVILHGTKKGKCSVCDKPGTRSKKFWQTLSPFNKRADGQLKTVDEIKAELIADIAKWKSEPLTHKRCEK